MKVPSRRSNEQQRLLTDLQLWALSVGASGWIIDLEPYERRRVAGLVRRLRLDPVQARVEVVVTDGTADLTARWAMLRPVPQLAAVPGRKVLLDGVGLIEGDGQIIYSEPSWHLIPLPEVA